MQRTSPRASRKAVGAAAVDIVRSSDYNSLMNENGSGKKISAPAVFMTVAEAAEKWGVTTRRVQRLLSEGRIPGAKKYYRSWMVPEGAEKPEDLRRGKKEPEEALQKPQTTGMLQKSGMSQTSQTPGMLQKPEMSRTPQTPQPPATPQLPLSAALAEIIEATIIPMPGDNPDSVLDDIKEDRARLHFESEFAYLRGDFELTKSCFKRTEGDDASRLRASSIAIAAAISTGDYAFYEGIESWLKSIIRADSSRADSSQTGSSRVDSSHADSSQADSSRAGSSREIAAFAELMLSTAYSGAFAPNMLPDWLKKGDFSALPHLAKTDAIYKRIKYFQCIGQFESMLAAAQTALIYSDSPQKITFHDIYLRIVCSIGCCSLGLTEEGEHWLLEAMNIALPHGFITPFAESASAFSGLLESLLKREYPEYYAPILNKWKDTFTNWRAFHNQFTKRNVTLILSLRKYEIAQLAAHRVPYAKIAEQFNISIGRVNNIMREIYAELYVSNRDELAELIM